jgi:hypothetical protein
LVLYEKDLEETDENYNNLKTLGRYSISHPYLSKYSMADALDRYEKEGIDISEVRIEYEKINKKLEAFEQNMGNARDKLFEELKHYVYAYHGTICFFLELDPIVNETENDMNGRDTLEILMMELDRDYDLHDMKIKVTALDDVLKCRFELKIDTIMKECPSIEREDYPDSFWWRHPSKILRKVEESRKESSMM